uniref:CBS domain-containing protein n=1 Tax=Rhabditophanes sp. KR3021 TaxID=114890 RepID=A0AC35UBZ5_9BILA
MTLGKNIRPSIQSAANLNAKLLSSQTYYVTPGTRIRPHSFSIPLNSLNVVLLNNAPVSNFTANYFERYGAKVSKYCENMGSEDILRKAEKNYEILKLTHDNGQSQLIKLLRRTDLLIDNLAGNCLERYNINCDELMKFNSRLIIARTSSYDRQDKLNYENPSEISVAFKSGVMNHIFNDNVSINGNSTLSRNTSINRTTEENTIETANKNTHKQTNATEIAAFDKNILIRSNAKAFVCAAETFTVTQILMALIERNAIGNRQVLNLSLVDNLKNITLLSKECESKVADKFNRVYTTRDNDKIVVGICDTKDIHEFLSDLCLDEDCTEREVEEKIKSKSTSECRMKFQFSGYITIINK